MLFNRSQQWYWVSHSWPLGRRPRALGGSRSAQRIQPQHKLTNNCMLGLLSMIRAALLTTIPGAWTLGPQMSLVSICILPCWLNSPSKSHPSTRGVPTCCLQQTSVRTGIERQFQFLLTKPESPTVDPIFRGLGQVPIAFFDTDDAAVSVAPPETPRPPRHHRLRD